jgi:[acyl-carrier-protein] S-malonyltransferase
MSLGFVFPGQGSQQVGMLGDLIAQEASVRECFEEAGATLSLDLTELVTAGPEAQLNRTEFTQPSLLTASVALWRLWQNRGGPSPSILAGHSLGEYSALVCAGALSFADGVRLVSLRGSLMQASVAAGEGAMAAILGLEDDQVIACCADASSEGVVAAANFNAPGQVVIAGASDAVDTAIERCQEAGARRAVKLEVSVPSHCALMLPAAQQFEQHLVDVPIALPSIPVVHNVDAAVSEDADGIRRRLVAQLSEPVRWTACAAQMAAQGADTFVECGPGKVLAGLQKRIDKGVATLSVATPETLSAALTDLSP